MSGLQPQTLGVLAPQVWPEGHDGPQLTVPPQVSLIIPQLSVEGQPVSLVHPQTFGTPGFPAPQVWPAAHVPQWIVPPQPSGMVPQLSPVGQALIGVQPQTLGEPGFPPPQVCPAGQAGPQVRVAQPASGGVYVPQLSGEGHVVGH